MLHLACETALAHSYFCMDRTSTISGSGRRGLAGNKTRRGGGVKWKRGEELGKVRCPSAAKAPCTSSTVPTRPASARMGSVEKRSERGECVRAVPLK